MKKTSISKQIVTVTLNPSLDTVLFIDGLHLGESNNVQRVERDAGGKGINLSRVVSKLGGDTVATGFLAGGIGAHILKVLDSEHVPNDFVNVKGESRESILIKSGDGPPTELNQAGPFIKPGDVNALFEKLHMLLPYAGWVTIGGSVPPGLEQDIYVSIILLARRYGCHILVDAEAEELARALGALPILLSQTSGKQSGSLARNWTVRSKKSTQR